MTTNITWTKITLRRALSLWPVGCITDVTKILNKNIDEKRITLYTRGPKYIVILCQ
jgi:hypothetical protein